MAIDFKKMFNSEEEVEIIENDVEQIGGSRMILLEPRAFSESQQIADYLRNKNTVVVNLKRVTNDQARRIVDFLSGTVYALEGDLQKIGSGIFLCTPKTVNVQGKITEEDNSIPERTEQGW